MNDPTPNERDSSDGFGIRETQGISITPGFLPEPIDVSRAPWIDRYKICELIGEGGMGAVYVARQEQPVRRKVALKIIRAGVITKETMARFSAERQALAMMDHPNIAKVLDGGAMPAGQPYLVMELVQGLPITKYANVHQLNTHERLRVFLKVCHAVEHAHRKGVIHRDLKPSNVLVAKIDDEAVPKVIDFGLAKALDHPLTDNTVYTGFAQMVGTPMYMSPEQAEMGVVDVDTRSDVYSLGVLLYELIVGTPPFDRETFKTASFDEVRRIIREVRPPLPSTAISTQRAEKGTTVASRRLVDRRKLHETMRGELDWLIMKALEKDRRRRYAAAAELADDIQRFLSGDAVLACPPSRLYQLRKTLQRHRLPIAVSALVLFSLITVSAVSIWHVLEVRRANAVGIARERRANDLLESNQLQSALAAFRTQDLVQLARITGDAMNQHGRSAIDPIAQRSSLLHFLHSAARPSPVRRIEFSVPIHEIAVSADGRQAICVGEDGNLTLLPIDEPETPPSSIGTHGEPAHAVAISPDSSTVVSGSTSGVIKYWNLEKAVCVRRLWPVRNGIESLVWSPDGRWVAAGSRYHSVWVGDAEGNEKFRVENDQRHETLLFSPNSQELFVPTRQGIHVYDVATAKHLRSIDTNPFSNIRAMGWAGPDRQWLIAGERYLDSLAVFDRESGSRRGTFNVSAPYAKSLATSPDGMSLVVGYGDGKVQMIRLSRSGSEDLDGHVEAQFAAHRQNDSRLAVSWVGDAPEKFATAGSDAAVQVWGRHAIVPSRELASPMPLDAAYLSNHTSEPVTFLRGQAPNGIPIVTFSPHSADEFVAFGTERQISVVSLLTRRSVATISSPLKQHQHLSLSRDGSQIAAVGDGQVYIWKSVDRWSSHELVANYPTADDANVVFADQNQTLILGNEADSQLLELEIESGRIRRDREMSDPDVIALSNNQRLIAAGNDAVLTVWDRRSDQKLLDVDNVSGLWALSFLADDRVLLSGHNDGRIMAWHIPTGQPLGVLHHPRPGLRRPRSIQVAPDGRRMMVIYPSENGYVPVLIGGD